ncbi:MAG: hypothetical protein U1A77_21430 [Pirellulales bacterium]
MRRFLIAVVVLAIAMGAIDYGRGWFSLTKEDSLDLQVDADNSPHDRTAFRNAFSEQLRSTKDKLATLRKQTERLTSDDRSLIQQQLDDLAEEYDRLEKQINELGSHCMVSRTGGWLGARQIAVSGRSSSTSTTAPTSRVIECSP